MRKIEYTMLANLIAGMLKNATDDQKTVLYGIAKYCANNFSVNKADFLVACCPIDIKIKSITPVRKNALWDVRIRYSDNSEKLLSGNYPYTLAQAETAARNYRE